MIADHLRGIHHNGNRVIVVNDIIEALQLLLLTRGNQQQEEKR
jgi:hypothetical protein